jgi:transglutaminase-like putative cysteine protease
MSAPTATPPAAPAEQPQVRPGTDVPRSLTVPGVLAPTLASWGAVLLAALCLGPLFDGSSWFGATLLVVTAVVAVGGLATWLRVPMVLVPVLCAVALFAALVWRFTDSAPWGFIPTFDALGDLRLVLAEGSTDISRFAPPVPVSEGLAAVTALGVGSVALVVVVLQVVLRLPAVAGLPLVAMYVVPAAVLSEGAPWWAFVLVVAGWLLLLATDERLSLVTWGRVLRRSDRVGGTSTLRGLGGSAFRLGAVAVAIALVLPVVIPGLADAVLGRRVTGSGGEGPGGDAPDELGIDPLVNLRRDLLDNPDVVVMRYTTDDPKPSYLRAVVLETFDGDSWKARSYEAADATPVADGGFASVPSGLPATRHEYSITARALVDSFLPLPEHPTSVSIEGDWFADDLTDVVFSPDGGDTTRDKRWDVEALDVKATAQQLKDSAPAVGQDRAAIQSSVDIPQSVRDLARDVTEGATTDYDMALALQTWFRSEFEYSTDVRPASSGDYLEEFLRDRVGYCEQFSASMALMATSLGIRSRVVVGFTPGSPTGERGTYDVSAQNAHAWPELWFAGVGWVAFEPTPGTATNGPALPVPDYADPENQPDPEASPTAQPSEAPPGGNPRDQDLAAGDPTGGAVDVGDEGSTVSLGERLREGAFVALILMALLAALVPAAIRWVRRRRRLAKGAGAEQAWAELRDTALDLGAPWSDSATPRQAVAALVEGEHLTGEPAVAAARLGRIVERSRYAPVAPASASVADDVSTVRHAVLARRRRGARVKAALAPASLRRREDIGV